ncbi:acyl-CoA thioester hydrolase/BAAT C-terminal domain-containing protein [Cellulomonas sp. MW9]|uniref:Acyl-CoA thioester hydrolase/BAAT C-terminal domain-containing protein n=2 Tax=Cellulomonas edaphi TaxID=3053468 RepID=A0ABT7S7E0_9CELL|nr:acyl-CoA thioester hydrolase/BAAT C-terminal domain-containing protein [Cellulomons edaphi]
MGPQWDPVPLADPILAESPSTAIGGAPTLGSYPVRIERVTVQLDGTTVGAKIRIPVGAPEPMPGVVFVHGAGTGSSETAFSEQTAAMAAAGIVTMVPDKRLDTYSARHRDYVAMAADYERSVALLRVHEGVDPARVGVYGESEGAWIAPVMAASDPRLAFVVLASAPVVPPREQAAFAADNYLRNTNVPHGVFRAIPRAVGMALPGGGFEYADFDVTPFQRKMTQPVLMVYGTGDSSMPIVQGAEQVLRDTAIAGNGDVTVRYYAGANHGLKIDGVMAASFLTDLSGWVLGLPATAAAPPRIAGDQPTQEFVAAPVPEPSWLRDGDVVIATVLVGAGLIVLPLVLVPGARAVEVVRRRRGRATAVVHRFPRGIPLRMVVCALGAVLTVAGLVWYLVAIAKLALDYEQNDVVVKGGWVGVRLLGIAAVAALVVLLQREREALALVGRQAEGVLRAISFWAVVVGCSVVLVVLAYWGVFQLGI